MKSNELASLAHVTVRTLRHYHQVGVLPEPPRGSNGYRDYTVHDLIRLLRIKRLAALGVSLDAMNAVLDADTDSEAHTSTLDQLDAAIDAEIERLQTQKRLIRLLRDQRAAPDAPPELGRVIGLFAGMGRSESAVRVDRDELVLLTHLFDDRGVTEVTQMYDLLASPENLQQVIDLTLQFDQLTGDPDGPEPLEIAGRMLALLSPLISQLSFDGTGLTVDEATANQLMLEFHDTALNPAQRAALEMMMAALPATVH